MLVSQIELAIASRLQPLRDALKQANVAVAALPKESGAYSEDVQESVDIIVSKATGLGAIAEFKGFQDVQYTITIIVTLAKRYQDAPEEKNVLDWVCSQIFKLLYNYALLPEARTGLSFLDYTPFKPSGGQWSAQMQFSFLSQARAYPEFSEGSLGIELVRLLASEKLEDSDATLLQQFPVR